MIHGKQPKRLYRIVLRYPRTITHSVFVRAHTREQAEKRALKQHPDALTVDRSPNPLS